MRKIEQAMVKAIRSGTDWAGGNTIVHNNYITTGMYTGVRICSVRFHNTTIAELHFGRDGKIITHGFWNGGYTTATTKSRINTIAREFGLMGVYQKDFKWYYRDGTEF